VTLAIGAHVGNVDPIAEAASRKADLVQFFASNPQSWKKPQPRSDAESLRTAGFPIYLHAPYLVNVVSPNNRIRIPSRKILADTCTAAEEIGATAVIVHGGHVEEDEEVDAGFARWRKALDTRESVVPLLIENTAGGGNAVARQVEVIERLWAEIGDLGVGFCLDTCHFWSAGEPLETLVERVKAATGRIDLVHCNDSRDPSGSGRDRHTNLGSGQIPPDLLVAVVTAAAAPVVIETPDDAAGQAADIEWLRTRL
jgi:deoxyribonuclease IV